MWGIARFYRPKEWGLAVIVEQARVAIRICAH